MLLLITVAAADRKEEKTALFLSQEPAASCFGSYDSLALGQGASDCHNAAMHNLLLAVLQSKKLGFGKLLFLSRHLRISPNSPPTPPALTPPPGLSTLLSALVPTIGFLCPVFAPRFSPLFSRPFPLFRLACKPPAPGASRTGRDARCVEPQLRLIFDLSL